jgi:hypothetical protein
VIITALIAAGIALYFAVSFIFFPAYFQMSLVSRHPAPQLTSVKISPMQVSIGQPIDISVSATNVGDEADLQTVSVAFPNITSASKIALASQDFLQRPIFISQGMALGTNYTGSQSASAQYAAIEAQSWPWEQGKQYTIDLRVSAQAPGIFVILVKSVALPHNSDLAHYPRDGVVDQQQEFAQPYFVTVKSH